MTFVHEDERVSAEDRRNRSELHRATTEDRRNRFELHLDGDERVTLFVENIPRRMQWRGLWHLFARHREVSRAFIARKLSRGDKRFGFVDFKYAADANRAIERLNSFSVYGFKLSVKIANQSTQKSSRKRTKTEKNHDVQLTGTEKTLLHDINQDIPEPSETAVVFSTQYIARRPEEWGLNGISIRRKGGKFFLLSFEDEDLFILLEDLDWSYLKEIFQSIKVWSEKSRSPDRATWIEIRGVPLHAWNGITLKRIAAVWGNFEACGESHNMTLDAEKTSVLITTNYSGRINEIIQVEVGKDSFEVGVWELGFKDDAVDPLYQAEKKKMPVRSQLEDSSDSSSTSERVLSSGEKDNNSDRVCLLERAADLEKEVNLDGADRQLEENESCKGAGKGIAKKTWAEVLVDHRPTQSLSQTDSIPDLGPLSINMFSKTNAELEVWGGDLEPGLVGQHANKEIIQFEVVQSPKSIEVTGRVAELSSLDNFGELETIPSKIRGDIVKVEIAYRAGSDFLSLLH
ncbi:hypothetical protein V6N13_105226 [Hibiscus sabdariffa]